MKAFDTSGVRALSSQDPVETLALNHRFPDRSLPNRTSFVQDKTCQGRDELGTVVESLGGLEFRRCPIDGPPREPLC